MTVKLTIPEIAPLIVAYYVEQKKRHIDFCADRLPAGHCIDPLHIVMGDENVEAHWIPELLKDYQEEFAALPATRALAEALQIMSYSQRKRISRDGIHYYWAAYPEEAPQWWRDQQAAKRSPEGGR